MDRRMQDESEIFEWNSLFHLVPIGVIE
jgi:hypothetical protein